MVPDFLGKAIKIDLHKSSGIFPESYMILANSVTFSTPTTFNADVGITWQINVIRLAYVYLLLYIINVGSISLYNNEQEA